MFKQITQTSTEVSKENAIFTYITDNKGTTQGHLNIQPQQNNCSNCKRRNKVGINYYPYPQYASYPLMLK